MPAVDAKSNVPKLWRSHFLLSLFVKKPVIQAVNAKPSKKPKVGRIRYARPPPAAKMGTPARPRIKYTPTLVKPRRGPSKKPARRAKNNCSVKCMGNGSIGIEIFIKAPTAIKAANRLHKTSLRT